MNFQSFIPYMFMYEERQFLHIFTYFLLCHTQLLNRQNFLSFGRTAIISQSVGKSEYLEFAKRFRGRQESGKTRAGAREYTENHDITGDDQKHR